MAAKPKALSALFDWIEKVSEWFDDESKPFTLSDPPPEVSRAAKAFLDSKVHDPYDPSFTVRDWLRKISSDEMPLAKALVALLTLGGQLK